MNDPAYLLDTSVLVHLLEGHPQRLLDKVGSFDMGALIVSTVAYAEVMLGAVKGDQIASAIRLFGAFDVVAFDEDAARQYARLPFKRGSFDRLIAAHALSLGLPVVTANERDFASIPGLCVENWTK